MMLLQSDNMKHVYFLTEELIADPKYMALAQALTLDESRPDMGLAGTHGLFGSQVWWDNIHQGKIPLQFFSGVIQRAYFAGLDSAGINNTIDILLDDNTIKTIGIYVNKPKDAKLFKIGHKAEIVYVSDELKPGAAMCWGKKYNEVALEMTVSLEPVA